MDFYRLRASDLLTVWRLRRAGTTPTHFSASPVLRALARVLGLRRYLGRWSPKTTFTKSLSEYQGAIYRVEYDTIRFTAEYYEAGGLDSSGPVRLYNAHYETDKVGSVVRYILQRDVKRFLSWLHQHYRAERPPQVLVVPDVPLYRFIVEKAQLAPAPSWEIRFRGSGSHGRLAGLYQVVRTWGLLGSALVRHGLCWRPHHRGHPPIAFRAHFPRTEGLMRTDFLLDGERLHPGNVLFFLFDRRGANGSKLCAVLERAGYHYVVLNELPFPVHALGRLLGDYVALPLRAFVASLGEGRGTPFAALSVVSQLCLSSKLELVLDHFDPRVLFHFHSASHEMLVGAVLSQRTRCQFITYTFGITPFRAPFAEFAFQNAHAFFSWGPEVIAAYRDTHAYSEIVNVGFWGFPEYQKALARRDELRRSLGLGPTTRLIVFYDNLYFQGRSPFTARILYDFYRAALMCADLQDTAVVLKMKLYRNENPDIYPPEIRDEFRALWAEVEQRKNVTSADNFDWDPAEMIAASDANVTLEVSTPSTIALLCGKAGFFFSRQEDHVYHPLFPRYKGSLIFSEPEALVAAIDRFLAGGADGVNLVGESDLAGFGGRFDGAALNRFRQEALRRAGLVGKSDPERPRPLGVTAR